MILKLKGTVYLNLALVVCLLLDSPITLGTENFAMSTHNLRFRDSSSGLMKSKKNSFFDRRNKASITAKPSEFRRKWMALNQN